MPTTPLSTTTTQSTQPKRVRRTRQPLKYPMGSISSGTMREEDLIPEFCSQLEWLAKQPGILDAKTRRAHRKLVRDIETRMEEPGYYEDGDASTDLNEDLFDALDAYSAPYFYFGSHPGDGSDYGWWLSETWDEEFQYLSQWHGGRQIGIDPNDAPLKVSDLSDIPAKFRGEVAVVSDHGNVSLYVKTSRTLREIWSVV